MMSQLRLFDTHVHYNLEPLWPDWAHHWQTAQTQGVEKSLVVGTTFETSHRAVQIATQEHNLLAAVGIHPYELRKAVDTKINLQTFLEDMSAQLTTLLTGDSHRYICALGETGLDYFRAPNDPTTVELVKAAQQQSLELHLQLARHYNLPVILHVRDVAMPETHTPGNAYWDTLALITKHQPHQFVVHCASGPVAYLQAMVDQGAYVSFAGNSTYPSAPAIRSLLPHVPAQKILLETDAPYLPPQGFRGQSCEPWMITQTAEFLASHCALDIGQTYANAEQLFIRYNNST